MFRKSRKQEISPCVHSFQLKQNLVSPLKPKSFKWGWHLAGSAVTSIGGQSVPIGTSQGGNWKKVSKLGCGNNTMLGCWQILFIFLPFQWFSSALAHSLLIDKATYVLSTPADGNTDFRHTHACTHTFKPHLQDRRWERTGSGLSLQFRRLLLPVAQHFGHDDYNHHSYDEGHARHQPAEDHGAQ